MRAAPRRLCCNSLTWRRRRRRLASLTSHSLPSSCSRLLSFFFSFCPAAVFVTATVAAAFVRPLTCTTRYRLIRPAEEEIFIKYIAKDREEKGCVCFAARTPNIGFLMIDDRRRRNRLAEEKAASGSALLSFSRDPEKSSCVIVIYNPFCRSLPLVFCGVGGDDVVFPFFSLKE